MGNFALPVTGVDVKDAAAKGYPVPFGCHLDSASPKGGGKDSAECVIIVLVGAVAETGTKEEATTYVCKQHPGHERVV